MLIQFFTFLNPVGEQFSVKFVVKLVAKSFHQTLQSQQTVAHFSQNRQQNPLSLIGCKTSALEFDINIYVTFSIESCH